MIQWALVESLWRQRLASPVRMLLLGMILLAPLMGPLAAPVLGLAPLKVGVIFALILGAGMIGQEVSSGVVHLVFARPVTRAEYLVSRWFAVGAGAAALIAFQIVLAGLILIWRGAPPGLDAIALQFADQALAAFAMAAVVAALSSLVNGLADLALLFVLWVHQTVLFTIGSVQRSGWMLRASAEIGSFLQPAPELGALIDGTGGWYGLVAALSAMALGLALGIVLLNRKEFSYASG